MRHRFLPIAGVALCACLLLSGCATIKMNVTSDKCTRNLKRMSLAVLVYLNEHRNRMPGPRELTEGKSLPEDAFDDPGSIAHCPGCGLKYEFLIPANTDLSDPALYRDGLTRSSLPILGCPGHAHVVCADGHVD